MTEPQFIETIQSMARGSLETLQGHVLDESLALVHMIGVPRSVSTALGRALNESDALSIFVNEPFNREISEPEEAAEQILKAAGPIMDTTRQPLTVITKNMASYLSPVAYREMTSVADSTVWVVRDPLIQMGSLVTRLANDIHAGHGANRITQETLTPQMLQEVCALLVDSDRSKGFSKTGWASIGAHYRSGHTSERSAVVDGGAFTVDPEMILAGVCERIGLLFSSRMVDGWRRSYTNVINSDNVAETARSAWTSHAARSVGVVAVARTAFDLSQLPEPLQQHITEVAIPTYQEMLQAA